MFKRSVWLALGLLLVTALVLTSCQTAAPSQTEGQTITGKVTQKEQPTPTETGTKEAAAPEEEGPEMVQDAFGRLVEKPQYGGTITYGLDKAAVLIDKDPARAGYAREMTVHVYEAPVMLDWAKGPAGTGENPMTAPYVAPQFYTGALAESWEITDDFQTVVLQVRRGVYFHDKPPVNGREMTPDDILASFNRYLESPAHAQWFRPEDVAPEEWYRMEKTGAWELTYTSPQPNPEIVKDLLALLVTPREMIEAYDTLNEVEQVIGTGPFILDDVVISSSATWKRNPNYWMMDPIFPDNRLPYVDAIRGIVIEDPSARLAALRTHKVDHNLWVSARDAKSLMDTNPELLYNTIVPGSVAGIYLRTDEEPWSDVRVRQALQMAVNYQEMAETIYEGTPYIVMWPIAEGMPGYTPLEELPDNLKDLWTYNPDKAKQLLTEAGYSNGIKATLNMSPYWEDPVTAVKMYWADIGVDVELRVVDDAAFFSTITGDYEDMITWFSGVASLDGVLVYVHGGKPSWMNVSKVNDPLAVEFAKKFEATLDPVERAELLRVENLRQMEQCYEIPFPADVNYRFWAPWIKGYHGENVDYLEHYAWIDQDLKYEITGQR